MKRGYIFMGLPQKLEMDNTLKRILTHAYKKKASDIHMAVGQQPIYRINGALTRQEIGIIKNSDLSRMLQSLVSPEKFDVLVETKELDFSASIEGVSRFRVNAFFQKGSFSIVFRIVPNSVPTMSDLHMPAVLMDIIKERQGLVLVTGPTGSGKSTTLAAMINHLNLYENRHIITLEDPIEYVHESKESLIVQREVGVDTMNFLNGLRASLRQDPDVILLGELRDLETISTAVSAAETGHLVFGTLHTNSAVGTIERIIDMFPSDQQTQIQVQVASTLNAVIAQQLLPTTDGKGRRAATEIMLNTHAVKNQIASGKIGQIQNVLQTSRDIGMHTMDMDLKRLVREGVISQDTAAPYMIKG